MTDWMHYLDTPNMGEVAIELLPSGWSDDAAGYR